MSNNNDGDNNKSSDMVVSSSTAVESEVSSSQRLTTILLNEYNYLPWSRAVTIALGGRSRLGFINGKEANPGVTSPTYEAWLSKDQMVMSWILNSMERNIAEIFSYSESSSDLWEAVKDMYGNQNNSARVFQIQLDIANLRQHGKPFVNLLGKLKGLWNELEVYRPHSVDPAILRKRNDEDLVFQLLASLGSDFEDLKRHILMNTELPSLKSVCASIQREEVRRKVMTSDVTSNTPEVRAYSVNSSLDKKIHRGKKSRLQV